MVNARFPSGETVERSPYRFGKVARAITDGRDRAASVIMATSIRTDLSQLAELAQTPGQDLRATVLIGQAELFATAVHRDGAAVSAFEALALGLIPLVDSGTRAQLAARLALVTDTPATVRAALAHDVPTSLDDVIRVSRLDGHRLAELVELGRRDRDLAQWLLARPEPTIFDRAVLYRFARSQDRAAIRAGLAHRLPATAVPRNGLPEAARAAILLEGAIVLLAARMAETGIGPSRDALAGGLVEEGEQDLLVLGLVGLGFSPDECLSLILRLPSAFARDVAAVFRLAPIVRATPRQVALQIADPDHRVGELSGAGRTLASASIAPLSNRCVAARAAGDPRRINLDDADPVRRHREASGRPDRRSLATTGPGRT